VAFGPAISSGPQRCVASRLTFQNHFLIFSMKKLRITVEGKSYDVLVEMVDEGSTNHSPTPAAAPLRTAVLDTPAPTPAAAPIAAGGAGDVVSPLAGKVVSIDVSVGQTVQSGAQVATIEAMKMNTYIYAPKAGRISEIIARPGDGVEEGAPIMRIA
jgi:glutaconyl-CoA/methylmalonyl-CoA decarboxylase subunit gamma